ncbi:MAG: MBL fold metallo-hydrolase [Ruminococcus sp.]|nr:MBL fold metallo-hydrolase [Ruminococcus sp.]
MARIYPLFSSSKGNCTYFGDKSGGIIIDCGVSCKRICQALEENEIPCEAIKAVFVTHTHSDHVQGLNVFLKKHRVELYAQRENIEILRECSKLPEQTVCNEVDGREILAAGFSVTMFKTPHDSPESCGYRVLYPDGKIAVLCTDLGEVTESIWESIKGADLVLLEANYDEAMLKNGGYPYELKQRIASDHGHLSNSQCAHELVRLAKTGTSSFVLGHLSQENNTPDKARECAEKALKPLLPKRDYMLYIAPPCGGRAVIF